MVPTRPKKLKPIGKLANMIEKRRNPRSLGISNAYMEALNSVFSATKRAANHVSVTGASVPVEEPKIRP